jgi:hypothetical protein
MDRVRPAGRIFHEKHQTFLAVKVRQIFLEAGRYFLWGYHNGTKGYIEVTRAIFDYSRWHVYSVMVTWPLMLLAVFASSRIRRLIAIPLK